MIWPLNTFYRNAKNIKSSERWEDEKFQRWVAGFQSTFLAEEDFAWYKPPVSRVGPLLCVSNLNMLCFFFRENVEKIKSDNNTNWKN